MTNPTNFVNQTSSRIQLPNAPPAYDQQDQKQMRTAIMRQAEQASQQAAARLAAAYAIILQVTQLAPSPSTDAGTILRFQIDAFDPAGQTTQVEVVSVQGTGVAITSGPAAGVVSPNDTIWKVSLASKGTGPGTMICRGTTPDGRHTDASIPIPEIGTHQIVAAVTVLAPANDLAAQTQITIRVDAVDPENAGTPLVALTKLTNNSSIVSGSALGTFVLTGSQWTLARPPVLKGSAAAEFTADDAALDGLRVGHVYVDVPEQGQQGAPALVMSVGEDGHPVTVIVGNNDTLSYTWAEATATYPSLPTMPSDATALAGTLVNGSVVTVTSSLILGMGDRYMFKAAPWPQVNAGGTHGVIVSGQVDRQNKSATKTLYVSGAQFVPASNVMGGGWLVSGGAMQPTAKGQCLAFAWTVLPVGATITQFRGYLTRTNGNGSATIVMIKTGTGNLFSPLVHSTTGLQVLSQSLTEVVAAVPYLVEVVLDTTFATNAGDNILGHCEIDYTVPNFTTSV